MKIQQMKRFNVIGWLLALSVLGLACSDFLDEIPDNRAQLDSTDKIKQLLAGAYSFGSYYTLNEVMSDNAGNKGFQAGEGETPDIGKNAWLWNERFDTESANQDSPENFWTKSYFSIAQANEALNYINQRTPAEQQAQGLLPFKGEALIIRAYAHFMLVNMFAKHYNASTSSSDLGVPYVQEPETTLFKTYKRATVQEVYDLVEKDLLEGIPLLNDNVWTHPKAHFNIRATNAFATRFYLFKGDWAKTVQYATTTIGTTGLQQTNFRNWNAYRQLAYAQIGQAYGNYSDNGILFVADGHSWWGRDFSGIRWGLSETKSSQEFRVLRNVSPTASKKAFIAPLYSFNDVSLHVPKFREVFEFTNVQARTGRGHINMPLFTTEEALLSRAEAYAMESDSINALRDLNFFFKIRMSSYNQTDDSATMKTIYDRYYYLIYDRFDNLRTPPSPLVNASTYSPSYTIPPQTSELLKAIVDARRLEFWFEGMRWFDIRRLNITVNRNINPDGSVQDTLKINDPRRQLQIPLDAINNGGLKTNTR